jgi:hypothetical protein
LPFDNVLDQVTGNDPAVTDYILGEPAKCPQCRREIGEKTLVAAIELGLQLRPSKWLWLIVFHKHVEMHRC